MRRRNFIKYAGLSSAALTASANALTAESFAQAQETRSEKIYKVGLIGAGWYGKMDLFRLMQVAKVDVVAICDCDRDALNEAVRMVAERTEDKKEPLKYSDYRKMLAENKLDIVLIGTPDHWHALQMIDAVEAGADVYVQKPIGVDVVECQAMLVAARKKGAVVQVGLQRRSAPHLARAKREIIESGKLGKVGQVEIFSYYGGPGEPFRQNPEEVPDGFDFDMWCGPAPKLPYYPSLRRRSWRQRMEYGNGTLGDMGVHMFDMARWLLDLRWPKRITSVGGQYIKAGGLNNCPDTQTVIFDYDDMQIVWNHRVWTDLPDRRHPWGGYFYGKNGVLKASVFGYDFHRYYQNETESVDVDYELDKYPNDKNEPNIELFAAPSVREHMRDFVARIEDRGRPRSDIEEGAISTICCVLGNMSLQLGRALEWDEANGRVKNDDEANSLLARKYRAPWVHPTV